MRNRATYLCLAALIILLASVVRLHRVLSLPMFTDEVLHVTRAHRVITEGDTFDGLEQNKWLYVFTLAQFNPTGPEGPWIARYLNVLFAAVSVTGCIALGRLLDRRTTGLIAGLLYALLPMAVFHERQALVDPMMTAFGTVSLVAAVHLARRPRWWLVAPLALPLTAALLTKPAAAPYLVMPFVAVVVFKLKPNVLSTFKERHVLMGLGIAALGTALAVLATIALYQVAAASGTTPHDTHTFRYANTGMGRFGWIAFIARTPLDLAVLLEILWKYGGPGLIVLTALALFWALVKQAHWRTVLFLAAPAFVFAALPLLASRPTASDDIATRYLLPNAAALIVLAAIGLQETIRRLQQDWFLPITLTLTLAPMLWFNVQMYCDPTQANLTRYDQRIYVDEHTSGFRYRDVALYLVEQADGTYITGVGHSLTMLHSSAYVGPRWSNLRENKPGTDPQRKRIEAWSNAGYPIYVVEWLGEGDEIEGPSGTTVTYLYTVEPWQERDPVSVYRVIQID